MKSDSSEKGTLKWIILFILFLLVVVWQFSENNIFDFFSSEDKIKIWISQQGVLAPLVIIILIATAIVISPIPSAPVALVSGALFGHTLGTIYVVFGALSGAMIAFFIARKLGYQYVSKKISHYLPLKLVGSQNTLMMIVFLTRLAPFISFDVISYAAGLTPLTWFRFFIASLAGILPISFLLAHLGSEALNGEIQGIAFALLFLGAFTLVSILTHSKKRKQNEHI